MQPIRTSRTESSAQGWGNITLSKSSWGFKMMIPRNAPEDGRPLCTKVTHNGVVVWEYYDDQQPYQGVRDKIRVHLFEMKVGTSVQFCLVEVQEGDPDRLTRVYRMDGDEFSLEVEILLKSKIAKLWGMKVRMKAEEKRTLDRPMPPRN